MVKIKAKAPTKVECRKCCCEKGVGWGAARSDKFLQGICPRWRGENTSRCSRTGAILKVRTGLAEE